MLFVRFPPCCLGTVVFVICEILPYAYLAEDRPMNQVPIGDGYPGSR